MFFGKIIQMNVLTQKKDTSNILCLFFTLKLKYFFPFFLTLVARTVIGEQFLFIASSVLLFLWNLCNVYIWGRPLFSLDNLDGSVYVAVLSDPDLMLKNKWIQPKYPDPNLGQWLNLSFDGKLKLCFFDGGGKVILSIFYLWKQ